MVLDKKKEECEICSVRVIFPTTMIISRLFCLQIHFLQNSVFISLHSKYLNWKLENAQFWSEYLTSLETVEYLIIMTLYKVFSVFWTQHESFTPILIHMQNVWKPVNLKYPITYNWEKYYSLSSQIETCMKFSSDWNLEIESVRSFLT